MPGNAFADGMRAAYMVTSDFADDYKKNKIRAGLKDIYEAKPTTGDEKPAEKTSLVDDIVGGIKELFGTGDSKQVGESAPQAQREAAPVDVALSQAETQAGAAPQATQARHSFLGVTQDKPFSESDVNKIRLQKAADFMMANDDPEKALQFRKQAGQVEMQDRQLKAMDKEEARQKAASDLWAGTQVGQKISQWYAANQQFNQYQEALQKGADPKTLGLPPEKPQPPSITPLDTLQYELGVLGIDAQHGKLDPAKARDVADRFKNLETEGYTKALGLLQGGAPIERVAEEFNKSGKARFSPEQVVYDRTATMPDGTPSREIGVKMPDGTVMAINSQAELNTLLNTKEMLAHMKDSEMLKLKREEVAANVAQSLASAGSSSASAARTRAAMGLDQANSDAVNAMHQAQTRHYNANAEQTELENKRGYKFGSKDDGAGGMTVKDIAKQYDDMADNLKTGQMPATPTEVKQLNEERLKAIKYAEMAKQAGKMPTFTEAREAARRPDGMTGTAADGSKVTWDAAKMRWKITP